MQWVMLSWYLWISYVVAVAENELSFRYVGMMYTNAIILSILTANQINKERENDNKKK